MLHAWPGWVAGVCFLVSVPCPLSNVQKRHVLTYVRVWLTNPYHGNEYNDTYILYIHSWDFLQNFRWDFDKVCKRSPRWSVQCTALLGRSTLLIADLRSVLQTARGERSSLQKPQKAQASRREPKLMGRSPRGPCVALLSLFFIVS
jgi:hypothetical protein